MQPFHPAEIPQEQLNPHAFMARFHVSYEEAVVMVGQVASETHYLNDTYQVAVSNPHVSDGWPPMIHLSVKRLDKEPIRDWADMQTIKNMLVGPEHEGFEIYPAESRLVDMANQYHCWVFADPQVRIPIGWTKRMVMSAEESEMYGAKQRRKGC